MFAMASDVPTKPPVLLHPLLYAGTTPLMKELHGKGVPDSFCLVAESKCTLLIFSDRFSAMQKRYTLFKKTPWPHKFKKFFLMSCGLSFHQWTLPTVLTSICHLLYAWPSTTSCLVDTLYILLLEGDVHELMGTTCHSASPAVGRAMVISCAWGGGGGGGGGGGEC